MVNDSPRPPGHNTPVSLRRSSPASFKRLLDSAADDSLVEQFIRSLVRVPSARKHRKVVLVLNELAPGAGGTPAEDLVTVSGRGGTQLLEFRQPEELPGN